MEVACERLRMLLLAWKPGLTECRENASVTKELFDL